MKKLHLLLLGLLMFPVFAAQQPHGAYLGAKPSEKPEWFKESFLEFEEDVVEAAEQGKRVMLYFHQENCPYCARLVEENFADPKIETYIKNHFDGITINMWGDREVVTVGGKEFTEKTFAAALKVQFTPTLLFLNEKGKVILRLNGYYPPEKFRKALTYVAEKHEDQKSLTEYMLQSPVKKEAELIDEDFFQAKQNLQALIQTSEKPLAIYFQSRGCEDCTIFHNKVLTDSPTRVLINEMDNVTVDVDSDGIIVSPDGHKTTQKAYAEKLNIAYTPSIVLFDKKGKEVHRVEGFFKTFHVQSSLAYVLEQAYMAQPSFQRYISARAEKIREKGYDVDIWGYRSFHPADLKLSE